MFDVQKIRQNFPLLKRKINGKPIVYLDSTATSLKPQSVLDAIDAYYTRYTANVFRGIYAISEEATAAYEAARDKLAQLIHANNSSEVVFTRGTTESINLFASGIRKDFKSDNEIVVTVMEHHSNFVPWQQMAQEKGLELKVWRLGKNYELNLDELEKIITRKTKVLAITAVSNVLGTINPISEIVKAVKRLNATCLVLVDAAQAIPHVSVDVQAWCADAVAFSGHKMLGPTGIGVLWAPSNILKQLNPYQYGGDMIEEVHIDRTVFKDPPHKFEAGTPHIAGAIGLGAAVDYLSDLGMDNIRKHEESLTAYVLAKMKTVSGVSIVGPTDPKKRAGVLSFQLKGIHPHDIAQVLDEDNICIRVGYHCAQPLHEFFKIGPTARASFYLYTTTQDIDMFIEGLQKVKARFK